MNDNNSDYDDNYFIDDELYYNNHDDSLGYDNNDDNLGYIDDDNQMTHDNSIKDITQDRPRSSTPNLLDSQATFYSLEETWEYP